MSTCVCGADEQCEFRCEKHDRTLHGCPCVECQNEWAATHPRTAAAISRFAAGRGSVAAVRAASKAEATR